MKNRKALAIGAGIGLFVVLLWGLAVFYFPVWLKNKLERDVAEKSKGLYSLKIGNLEASLFESTLQADSILLTPNFKEWQRRFQAKTPDFASSLTRFSAKKLLISDINFIGVLFKKPLQIDSLTVASPDMQLTRMKAAPEKTEPFYKGLEEPVKAMHINRILVKNGAVSYKANAQNKTRNVSVTNLNLKAINFRLDSASFHNPNRTYFTEAIEAHAGNIDLLIPGNDYRVRGSISAGTASRKMMLSNMKLVPLHTPEALSKRHRESTTWMDISAPNGVVSGVDFPLFSRTGSIYIKSVSFEKPTFKAYNDSKNFPKTSEKMLPHDMLQAVPIGLTIEKAEVRNMFIRYDEFAEGGVEPGFTEVHRLNCSVSNISNDPNRMSAKQPAVCDFSFSIMGKGRIQATSRLNLLDKNCGHTIKGSIGKGDLTVLNSILVPAYSVKFKSGEVQGGNFNFNLTRNAASGKVLMRYTNFEIEVLNKEPAPTGQNIGKKIITTIANKLIIRNDNPKEGKAPVSADVAITRRKTNSFITYWRDCLQNGFLKTVKLEKFAKK